MRQRKVSRHSPQYTSGAEISKLQLESLPGVPYSGDLPIAVRDCLGPEMVLATLWADLGLAVPHLHL